MEFESVWKSLLLDCIWFHQPRFYACIEWPTVETCKRFVGCGIWDLKEILTIVFLFTLLIIDIFCIIDCCRSREHRQRTRTEEADGQTCAVWRNYTGLLKYFKHILYYWCIWSVLTLEWQRYLIVQFTFYTELDLLKNIAIVSNFHHFYDT